MFAFSLMATTYAADLGTMPEAQACRSGQLRISLDHRGGDLDGMSHAGVELSIRNIGADCTLLALPLIELRDYRGRALHAYRQAPVGMHPGPVMVPVRIAHGHRAATDLRWVSGPVFAANQSIRVATAVVRFDHSSVRAPLKAVMFGAVGEPIKFDQTPLHEQMRPF